jgi:hypothetical protein
MLRRSPKNPLATGEILYYIHIMSQVAQLLHDASSFDSAERLELVSSLLEDLDLSPHYATDEEALKRRDDLVSGKVTGLSEDEFWKACGRR